MNKPIKPIIRNIIKVLVLTFCIFLVCCSKKASKDIKLSEQEQAPEWEPVKEIPYDMVVSVDIIRELGFQFTRSRSNKAVVLIKPGMNPLTYIPTEEDEKAILKADVFFYMGLGLEPGIEKLVQKIKDKVRCIAITSRLDRNLLLKSDIYDGGYDPHIWWGPDVWERLLLDFTKILAQIDPAGEFTYSSVYLRYGEATNLLNHRFMELWMNAIPEERRFLITLHPAYTYFGRLYGFTVKSILDPFKDDYSLARINELADFIIFHKVPVIFPEDSYSLAPLEELKNAVKRKGYNVEIGPAIYSYFLEQDMADNNYRYLNAARTMGRAVYDALKTKDVPGVPD